MLYVYTIKSLEFTEDPWVVIATSEGDAAGQFAEYQEIELFSIKAGDGADFWWLYLSESEYVMHCLGETTKRGVLN